MSKLNYFLPFVFAVITFFLVEWCFVNPNIVYVSLVLLIVLNTAAAFLLGRKKQSDWWKFLLLPALANVISVSYAVILTNQMAIQSIALLLIIFNYIYWRYVFYYLHRQNLYIPFSLENLSFYVSFIIIFLLGSLIYGLRSLLSLNILILGVIVLICLSLIVLQVFWISKLNWRQNKVYLLVMLLVLMEEFFMLSLLPLDYNILGFVWATTYYLTISLVSDKLKDRLTRQKVKYLLILTAISWLVLFVSARWI
jgi:hypothetical protein